MARHPLVTGRWIAGKPTLVKAVATRRNAGSEAHPATHAKLCNVAPCAAGRSVSSSFRARRALRLPLLLARMADLAIADGTVKARPVMVEVERMESTTPLCLASIQRFPAASVQYIVPCSVGPRIASAARNDRCSV